MHSAKGNGKIKTSEARRLRDAARIKSRLHIAQLTLTEIDKRYGLPSGTAGNSLHEPNIAGERAIAAALKTRPHLLWFTRYHASGERLSPQPAENYRYGRRAIQQEAA